MTRGDIVDQVGSTSVGHTIATICARGGSKGLPGKNIRPFAGQPLIVHTIAQALQCGQFDGVFVSTDDHAIAEVARVAGAAVPYLRPAELASDTAAKLPVIEHLVQHLEQQGRRIARVVDLQPTSPLRDVQDITKRIHIHLKNLLTRPCNCRNSPGCGCGCTLLAASRACQRQSCQAAGD